jgi:hypothetical protein
MFQQPNEPSDADASNVPPAQPPVPPPVSPGDAPQRRPRQERVRHVIYGSREGLDRTVKILHGLGYADPNDWSTPIHSGTASGWMVIMTKTFWLA